MRHLSPALAAALTLTLAGSAAAQDKSLPPITKPKVEIVFALDTTGSMGGLIAGAKQKIWFIANEVLKAKQKPDVRIGLVAYRDKGDAYVTQALPLTDDLDKVYETLMGYTAGGGGDGPEHVNAALDHAVNKMQWSDDRDTLKLVFLVGDAPPHMDYDDDVSHVRTSQIAVRRNIYINTIQCGADASTTAIWQQIARNSEGRYAAIAQNGGVVAVATPFDEDLRRLGAELDRTRLVYGRGGAKAERKRVYAKASSMASGAPASVAADRASVKGKKAPSKAYDFVSRAAEDGDAAFAEVEADELPDELRGKSLEEQKKMVKAMEAKRENLQKEIASVSKRREAYLAAEREKSAKKPEGFDAEVVEMIQHAGKKVGLEY